MDNIPRQRTFIRYDFDKDVPSEDDYDDTDSSVGNDLDGDGYSRDVDCDDNDIDIGLDCDGDGFIADDDCDDNDPLLGGNLKTVMEMVFWLEKIAMIWIFHYRCWSNGTK